jgi:hypothetical protein
MEKGKQIFKLPEGWIETRIDVLMSKKQIKKWEKRK